MKVAGLRADNTPVPPLTLSPGRWCVGFIQPYFQQVARLFVQKNRFVSKHTMCPGGSGRPQGTEVPHGCTPGNSDFTHGSRQEGRDPQDRCWPACTARQGLQPLCHVQAASARTF